MFNIINEVSEKTLEKMFLQLLKDFTPQDLAWAASNNVSLLTLTSKNQPRLLKTASGMARGFKNQGYLLTTKNVMVWLESRRKDLWLPLSLSPTKRKWMSRQVDDFRRFLFEI